MIVHPFQSTSFYATDLQSHFDEINYSPTNMLLVETQQRIRRSVREISRHAIDYHQATMPGQRQPMEREVVEFVELIADAMMMGDVLTPLRVESRTWMQQNMAVSAEWLATWERVVQGLIQGGLLELQAGDFLLWQQRMEVVLGALRRMAVAIALEPRLGAVANKTAEQWRNFLHWKEAATGPEMEFEGPLSLFLTQWIRLLKFGSTEEVHLNLSRFWAEQFAPRMECAVPEWQFFIAALDMQVREAIGAPLHRHIASHLDTLHHGAPRLAFCGLFYRRLAEVETTLEPLSTGLPFKWQEFVQEALGEIVWQSAPDYAGSPTVGRILQGVNVLCGAKSSEITAFGRNLVNSSRHLCERNWLDWLESHLAAVQNALQLVEQRAEAADATTAIVRAASSNLREAREVFSAHSSLDLDLAVVLEASRVAVALHGDIHQARRAFRYWFTQTLALRRNADYWRHAQTMVRALTTAVRQSGTTSAYWQSSGAALGLLEDLVVIAPSAEWLPRALDEITHLSVAGEGASCQRDIRWVLRQSAIELVRSGAFRAPAAVLNWTLKEVLPFAAGVSGENFEQTYQRAYEKVCASAGPLNEPGFASVLKTMCAGLPGVLASHHLWQAAEVMGEQVALRVYSALPEYAESTGERGKALCARDNSLTLRRLALVLQPGVLNPGELLAEWWANLINGYVATRPERLFQTNLEKVREVCGERLSRAQVAICLSLLEPLYQTAITSAPAGELRVPPFHVLGFELPLLDSLKRNTGFFAAHAVNAWQYVHAITPGGSADADADGAAVAAILADGWTAYLWSGSLAAPTVKAWAALLEKMPANSLEALLQGYMQTVSTEPEPGTAVQLLGYLQELLDFNRQCAAGNALASHAQTLAQKVTDSIHRAIPKSLSLGVSRSKPETCARDLGMIFNSLAKGLQSLPRSGARLHLHRCLAEQIAPHVAYGEQVWRMVWQTAAQESEALFNKAVWSEFCDWCTRFEQVGRHLAWLGRFNRYLLLREEPHFSSDPQEEWQWRQTLSTLLVLGRCHRAGSSEIALLCDVVCSSLPLVRQESFGEQLEAVQGAFKSWFVDLDLGPVEQWLASFLQHWSGLRALQAIASQIPELNAKLATRLPFLKNATHFPADAQAAFNRLTLTLARAVLHANEPEAGNAWGVLPAQRSLEPTLAGLLSRLSAEDYEQWGTALSNAFSTLPGAVTGVRRALAELRRAVVATGELAAAWNQRWDFQPGETAGATHASCQRDLQWMARRLALDGVLGRPVRSHHGAAAWYASEVLPFSGSVDAALYRNCFAGLASIALKTSNLTPAIRQVFVEFSEASAGLLGARWLHDFEPLLATAVVEALQGQHPGYFTALTAEQRQSCHRDTRLTLRALARAAAGLDPGFDFIGWWKSSIGIHLGEADRAILPAFRHCLIDVLTPQLDPAALHRVDAALAGDSFEAPLWREVSVSSALLFSASVDSVRKFFAEGLPVAWTYAGSQGPLPHRDFLCEMLTSGYGAFLFAGTLAGETTQGWRKLMTTEKASWVQYERLLQGLLQNTETRPAVIEAVNLVSFLQECLEFHRQCLAGLALGEGAAGLARKVTAQIHLAIPDLLACGVSAVNAASCERDLGMIFSALGRVLASHNAQVAVLRFQRLLAEEIAPHVGYGEAVWRMLWQIAAQEAESIFESHVVDQLANLFAGFEDIGRHLPVVGVITGHLLSNQNGVPSDTPVRRDLSAVVALTLCDPATAAAAYSRLFASRFAHPAAVTAMLDLWLSLKSNLGALDLTPVDDTVRRFADEAGRWAQLATIPADAIRRLPSQSAAFAAYLENPAPLHTAAIHFAALAAAETGARITNRWGVPRAVGLADEALLNAFAAAGPMDLRLWTEAFPIPAEWRAGFESQTRIFAGLAAAYVAFSAAWKENWSISPVYPKRSLFDFGSTKDRRFDHASCGRDLRWTARRIALDSWTQPVMETPRGAVHWFEVEVIPYAGSISSEEYAACFAGIVQAFERRPGCQPVQTAAAGDFAEAANRTLLAHKIATHEAVVAGGAIEALYRKVPDYAKRLNDAQRQSCLRDTRLTLRALAAFFINSRNSTDDFRLWWQTNIALHLRGDEQKILPAYREGLLRSLGTVLSKDEIAAVKDLFAGIEF